MADLPEPDFRALFEGAPGLFLVLTPSLHIVAVSDAYLRATMTTRAALLGRGVFEAFPDNPDDPAADGVRNLRQSLERVLATGRGDAMAVQKYDVRRPAAEGGGFEERFWSPFNAPVHGPDGEVAFIIHQAQDVTEFVRLKQAGSEREQLNQALQSRADEMEAEIYQRAQQVAEANRQLTQTNDALARVYQQITHMLDSAGGEIPAGTPLSAQDMPGRVGQLIAGHQRLEEQLRQSQKMEAVGRLAGGVAHDFNNLLTVITGYAAMLRDDLPDVPELEEIEKASMRAAALTHKLLAFSRKQVLQPRVVDLNAVITGMEELLRRLIGEQILLAAFLGRGPIYIKADPNQLEQVIMNLAVNARDAMAGGGRLIIESGVVELNQPLRNLQPGVYAVLSVADTGHGMDAQTAARIFEPFFTTKDLGRGTGLGLSTVYGIVEQSGGTITVESEPGQGARFQVHFPIAEAAEESVEAKRSAGAVGSAATVLLVEDEAPLRRLISVVLAGAGHQVLEAANGEEALLHASLVNRLDLVVTDVIMPGMKGPELVNRLRVRRPNLTVLYMSGYDRDLVDAEALENNASFLPKPFAPKALLARVGELMGAPGSARGTAAPSLGAGE